MSSEFNLLSEVNHTTELKTDQITSRTHISTANQKTLKVKRSMVARINDGDDELKKQPDEFRSRLEEENLPSSL